jgi:hypothetical protein
MVLVPGVAAAADETVLMDGGHFVPPSVEITVGDTVTWTNRDALLHDASGDGWATEQITDDESTSVTFDTAGSFDYICTIHPSMTGTVVVLTASSGATPTPPPADAAAEASAASGSLVGALVVLGFAAVGLGIGLRRTSARR